MKKTYLIPQVTKQEVRLTTQICSEVPSGGGADAGESGQNLAPGRLYI